MVSEALDGLTDEQLADLELQESGLVSGQNQGAIASTPFAQRMNPQPSAQPAPEPEAPVALSEYELNRLEEENYRRTDYVMTPQEFDQYWDRRSKEDNEVGRFIDGIGQGAAGLLGMVPEAGRELRDGMVGMVTDPINQAQRNIQTGAEIIRKGGINLVQLFDWVSNKVDDLATSSKRAEAINAGIRAQLEANGQFTGDRSRDDGIYQAALDEARKAGAYKPTAEQVQEDRGKAYERYVREKALERDFANVTQFKTGESQMSVPTSAETYQVTDEQPMQTVSTLGSMVVDPVNLVPLGAGALSKARVLRRIANLSEKPLLGVERAASGLADVAERVELGIANRVQDITGLTQKQQAALGAGIAGTTMYVDSQTEGGGGLTKAVLMAGAVMPTLHYGGGLLRKVGSAAGGAATIVREAGVGGLGVARAEAASNLAGNAAIPERYRKFFTGYVDGTDSTLKRVAQNADNPEALRRVSRFADRMGATQVARVADDAVSGAVTAGIVGTPFAALQPDAERAGEVMGGILTLGAAGSVVGGAVRRRGVEADADVARMFADVQAVGGNVEAFARLPHATLDRLAAMQGVLAGKVDFVPLTGEEYRMNADIAQNGGEATAGVFLDKDANNRARVFINLDGKTATEAIAPHEIGHAILTSNVLDGQPRADLRNLVNQQYGPEGVETRGREYIARMVDADLRQGVTGEAPTVLTEAEMKAMEGGKTMDDIVADRAKDPAERDRMINERMEEFRQRSIDKGEDAMDWARDEIIAETFASEAPAIDFRAIRRDAMFPRIAESMLSASGRVLEMFGANLSSTGRLMDNPSVLFRDNPLFQDRIMQKRVREYVRSYDQYLAGLEEAGAKELRGVELARSSKPEDLARSTHVKLRDEGRGVLENDFLFQKPDGTYSLKPQKIITATENARSAQIKTLYDARKFVPVNSQEFGKRKVNGREVIGGPVLPPQFDLFTNFPKHVREFARQMERSREEGGSWDIDYNAIGTGASGRYRVTNLGNVRAIQRETVPYGWIVSKANHLLAASLDLNAFRASAMKAINRGDLGLFNNDMRQVEADLKTYLANHRNGLPGEATIGQQKRDMLNGLIGTGTAVQRTANPLYSDLNPRGSIRTWRVDRLNDAKPTGRTGYFFDYDKVNNNRMPRAIPQSGQAMPDAELQRQGFSVKGYHGGRAGYSELNTPAFVASSPDFAKWYAGERGDGTIYDVRINPSKMLDLTKDPRGATLQWLKAMQKDGIKLKLSGDTRNDGTGAWSFESDLIRRNSPYDGGNALDMVYAPEVQQWLRKNGYDGVHAFDTLENTEAPVYALVNKDAARLVQGAVTGRPRGQAMPDVGSGDQGVTMPTGTVTQLTNAARKALPRLPRGASNVPKVVVQVQRRGKDRLVKTIAGEKLVPGEMKKPKDIVVDGGDPKSWNGYTGEFKMPLPNIKLDKTKGVSWSKQDIYEVAQTDRAKAQANAQQSVQAAAMAAADPLKFVDPVGYSEIMRAAGVAGDILIPPSGLKLMLTDPAAFVGLLDGGFHGNRTVPGTRAAAMQGLDGVVEMRQLVGGQPSPFNTALHHFWGTLSKQLDVINQEAAWMRLVLDPAIIEAIDMSIAGRFSMIEEDWALLVANALNGTKGDFRGKGNNAKSNANSFYNALVYHNGRWDEVAALYANNNAIDMRAQFNALGHGKVGMKNKVQGFVGLSFGVKGSVLDRWRFVDLYLPEVMGLTKAATPEQYFKYVGASKVIPQDPIGIYKNYGTLENDNPAFSLALYNSLDSVAQVAINNSPELRNYLGAHADPGGLHWVTWNSIKNEAVGHSSLDITKNFVRQYGRNGSASDFAKFVQTASGFVEGSNDAGQIIRLSLQDGVFSYSEK